MRRSPPALPSFGLSLVPGVCAGCHQPLLPAGPSRRYSANLSSDAWSHATAVPQTACACFFVCVIGLPLGRRGSASRFYPRNNFSAEVIFEGCRHSITFKPPSLLASQIVPTAVHTATGQLRLLSPGRTCFVASARTGHANRPNTGN